MKKTEESMQVDGVLDEISWSKADVSGDFMENFPSDISLASAQSEVRMTSLIRAELWS